MKTRSLIIFTRTPLHVGAGSSVGIVDQPVIRERHTGFPIIPGSAVKGVLRDHFRRTADKATVDKLFGPEQNNSEDAKNAAAGQIAFGEARLLAFPVRSAKGSYALVTCPLALARYKRDTGIALPLPQSPTSQQCLAGPTVCMDTGLGNSTPKRVVLEEYGFTLTGDFPADWAGHLSNILPDAVLNAAKSRWVLLSDEDFAHFALNACRIDQHIRIDPETGTVAQGALFNTETVPSETLFHAPLTPLAKDAEENKVFDGLTKETLLQFGGDATTGLGFCSTMIQPIIPNT